MATVVGLFRDMNTAEQAINDLKAAGYDPSRVGVVTRSKGTTQEVVGDTGTHDAAAAAGIGAVEGAIVGGGLAALIATGVIASIPFVGPIVLAGALATPLGATALGAVVGGVTGAAAGGLLAGMGVPEEEAKYYQGAISEGGILLTVDANDDNDAANASNILRNAGAEDIENRAGGVSTMTAGDSEAVSTAAAPAYAETTTTTSGPHNVGADTAGGAVAGGVIGAVVGGPVGAAAGAALGGAAGAGTGAAANAADRNVAYTDTANTWDNNAPAYTETTTGGPHNVGADTAGGAVAGGVIGAVVGGPVGAAAGAALGGAAGAGTGAAANAADRDVAYTDTANTWDSTAPTETTTNWDNNAPAYTDTTAGGPHNVGADTAGGAAVGAVGGALVGGPIGAVAGAALGGAAGAGAGEAANATDRNATYTDTTNAWDNNAPTTTTTGWGNNAPADNVGATTAGGAATGAVAGAVVGGPVGAVVGGAIGAATGAGAGAAVNAAERNDPYAGTTTPGSAVDNAAYNTGAAAGDVGHELKKPLPDHEQVGGAVQETWGNVKRGVGEAVGSPGLAASGEKDVVQGEEHRAEGDLRNEAGDTRP